MKILKPKEKFILRFYVTRKNFTKTTRALHRRSAIFILCKVKNEPGVFEFSVTTNLIKAGSLIKSLNL